MGQEKKINNLTSEKIDGSTVKGGFGFKKLFGIFKGKGNSGNPSNVPGNGVSSGLPQNNSAPTSAPEITRDGTKGISTEGLPHFNPNSHSD